MLLLGVNIILAAVPAVLLVLYFYKKDSRKKEPAGLILRVFILGFIAVIPAGIIEAILVFLLPISRGFLYMTVKAFAVAGLVEEGIKYLVIRIFIYNRKEFDEVTDGIVYTITASLGFAFFENIFYSFGSPAVLVIRGLTAVPLHASASGILGYHIGLSKFNEKSYIGRGLAYAVLIHGFYDFFLFTGTLVSVLVLPLLIFSLALLLRLNGKAKELDRLAGRS